MKKGAKKGTVPYYFRDCPLFLRGVSENGRCPYFHLGRSWISLIKVPLFLPSRSASIKTA